MARRGNSFVDAAYELLREAAHPMPIEEIARVSLDRGLTFSNAQDPVKSLASTLRSEVTQRPNIRGFILLEDGQVSLAEWGEPTTPVATTHRRRRRRSVPSAPAPLPGITLEKLERIRHVMSPDDFDKDWGELFDRLTAEERAKWISAVTDKQLAERTRAIVQRIHSFLQGSSTEIPKSELICDWIFICYTLELFREGAALWRYVNKDEIDALKYERTAKLSTACRARVGS